MKHAATLLLKVSQVLCLCVIILTGIIVVQYPACAAAGGANILFILDGSGMWGRLDNVEKIVIAKDTMSDLVQNLPDSFTLGLMVYGHRRKGDCEDIELLSPLGQSDPTTIIKQIQSVSPKGKTPITKSIILAGQQLEAIEEETTIVLVSDGEETCEGDPCEYVRTLKQKGIDFTMHVVGFDVNDEQKVQLSCIAEAGGGRYFSAQNAVQLKEAFTEVKTEVIKKVETKTKPEKKSEMQAVRDVIDAEIKGTIAQDLELLQSIWASDGVIKDFSARKIHRGWEKIYVRYKEIFSVGTEPYTLSELSIKVTDDIATVTHKGGIVNAVLTPETHDMYSDINWFDFLLDT